MMTVVLKERGSPGIYPEGDFLISVLKIKDHILNSGKQRNFIWDQWHVMG